MNLKIPLPRIPDQVVQAMDRYSEWAEKPAGPNLRFRSWHCQVRRRDWVSIGQILTLALGYMWWTSGGGMAFGIGVACGVLMWIAAEAYYHGH
jgi:hypothetical protein